MLPERDGDGFGAGCCAELREDRAQMALDAARRDAVTVGDAFAAGLYTPDTAPVALRRHLAGTGSLRAADRGFAIWLR